MERCEERMKEISQNIDIRQFIRNLEEEAQAAGTKKLAVGIGIEADAGSFYKTNSLFKFQGSGAAMKWLCMEKTFSDFEIVVGKGNEWKEKTSWPELYVNACLTDLGQNKKQVHKLITKHVNIFINGRPSYFSSHGEFKVTLMDQEPVDMPRGMGEDYEKMFEVDIGEAIHFGCTLSFPDCDDEPFLGKIDDTAVEFSDVETNSDIEWDVDD